MGLPGEEKNGDKWEAQATTPVDPPTPTDPTDPTDVPASVSLSESSVRPGDSLTVTGSGFAPGETVQVWIRSTPQLLVARVADANGAISVAVTVPLGTEVGEHSIQAIGLTSALEASAPLTVVAVAGGGGALGATGFSPVIALVGALLLVAGAGVYLVARRRRLSAGSRARSVC